jgi:hypothetical protein
VGFSKAIGGKIHMANENVISRESLHDGIALRELFHLVGARVMPYNTLRFDLRSSIIWHNFF